MFEREQAERQLVDSEFDCPATALAVLARQRPAQHAVDQVGRAIGATVGAHALPQSLRRPTHRLTHRLAQCRVEAWRSRASHRVGSFTVEVRGGEVVIGAIAAASRTAPPLALRAYRLRPL